MSKKKSIEDQEKELRRREEQIKDQLDNESGILKDRLIRVGKIAAISGIVALLGYWTYKTFFADDEEEVEEEKPKAARRTHRPNRLSGILSTFALPYIERIMDGFFDEQQEKEKTEK